MVASSATIGPAIRATRGSVTDLRSALRWAGSTSLGGALAGSRLGFYNGAFNPPTLAHAHIAMEVAAKVDCLWLDPDPASAHKPRFMDESHEARVQMCERLLSDNPAWTAKMGVGSLRKDMGSAAGNSPELFHALRALVGPSGHITWAVGADVALGMRHWRDKIMECTQPGETCDALMVFRRAGADEQQVQDALGGLRCDVTVIDMPSHLLGASSQRAREALVRAATLGRMEDGREDTCSLLMPGSVAAFCLTQPTLLAMYRKQLRALGDSEAGETTGVGHMKPGDP